MTWINNNEYPENKVFETQSTEVNEIVNDILTVVNQAIKMKATDKAENSNEIMLYANATNGYIGIYMYDTIEMTEVGHSSYLLELPKLWDISLNHEDGSIYFDDITESSAKSFAQTESGINIKKDYKIYFSNELGDMPEL
jgi:hypothetical protein